jgi:hypothetical protein
MTVLHSETMTWGIPQTLIASRWWKNPKFVDPRVSLFAESRYTR